MQIGFKTSIPLLLALSCVFMHAGEGDESKPIDPDDLPRVTVLLPDGTKSYHVRHLNRTWREAKVEELQEKGLRRPVEICFEAKYGILSSDGLKLLPDKGTLICSETRLIKYAQEVLTRGDNIWICGILRPAEEGAGAEFQVEDMLKMKRDLERLENKYARVLKAEDPKELIALGTQVGKLLNTNMLDFDERDKFFELQNRAWTKALELAEAQLDDKDAAGYYALALKWKDLLHKTHRYHGMIRKVLSIDANHLQATRIAVEELSLVKFRNQWVSVKDRDGILNAERKKEEDAALAVARQEDAVKRGQEQAAQERQRLLMEFQIALRTSNIKLIEGAYRSLGEAIQQSPDEEFARKAVDLLANVGDPSAIWPGLDLAAGSKLPLVRQDVYNALAWIQNENAMAVMATVLQKEEHPVSARVGVTALLERPAYDKSFVKTLINGLGNRNAEVTEIVVKGLQSMTGLKHKDKDAWTNWWSANRDQEQIPLSKPAGKK